MKGDLLIRDFWTQGAYIIHNMRVVNNDAASYQSKNLENCLETSEKGKKDNCLDDFLKQRWNFTLSVASVDGLLGVKSEVTLKPIASRLTKKWKEPYSSTCRYVKIRVASTLVREMHRCTRGGRVQSSRISMKRPQLEDGVGLQLFR